MKSKEAIRSKILYFCSLMWESGPVDRLDPMVKLLIEELVEELYNMQNRIGNIDQILLEKLAFRLTSEKHRNIRPGHCIIQISPLNSDIQLHPKNILTLKEPSKYIKNTDPDAIGFSPLCQISLVALRCESYLHHKTLYSNQTGCSPKPMLTLSGASHENAVYVGLSVDASVTEWEHPYFYIDYPHLPVCHINYQYLSRSRWSICGKELSVDRGFPCESLSSLTDRELDIWQYYVNNYVAFEEPIDFGTLNPSPLPTDLDEALVPADELAELNDLYWIKIVFPVNILPENLKKIRILENTFPVINRMLLDRLVSFNEAKMVTVALPILKNRRYLALDKVQGISGSTYHKVDSFDKEISGSFMIQESSLWNSYEPGIPDHLDRLMDLIRDEKRIFHSVNEKDINGLSKIISGFHQRDQIPVDTSTPDCSQEVNIAVISYEGSSSCNVLYWVTNGCLLNGFPAGNCLNTGNYPTLSKALALTITPVVGAKEYEPSDIIFLFKYLLTSRDRIVTKNNLIDFCYAELGKSIADISVQVAPGLSVNDKEGLVRTIYISIQLNPDFPLSEPHDALIKNLQTRLRIRSGRNIFYSIKITEA